MSVRDFLRPTRSTHIELRLEGIVCSCAITQAAWTLLGSGSWSRVSQGTLLLAGVALGIFFVLRPPDIASPLVRRWFFILAAVSVLIGPLLVGFLILIDLRLT